MPKATAVWLVENTTLTFEQIAEFCGMHPLEIQGIADGEVATSILGQNPVESGQISAAMLADCEADPKKKLTLDQSARKHLKKKSKGGRYTPVARRQDKPEAIAWLLKHHSYIPDSKIVKLIGTTKKTIESVRDKTHWNTPNMTPKDPVLLGLCSQHELDALIKEYQPQEPETDESQTA
jgi:hypothetical protein